MSSGAVAEPLVLRKARPVASQLADRLAPPLPDGLELYLDVADLESPAALAATCARLRALALPAGFVWLVEGPVRGLDGAYFDLRRDTASQRELIRRVAQVAGEVGARAVVVHLIAPEDSPAALGPRQRERALEESLPFLAFYAAEVAAVGAQPLVENLPPVLRQREAAWWYTSTGLVPADFRYCCQQVPGLRVTLDTSHAQLVVSAASACQAQVAALAPELGRLLAEVGAPASLIEFTTQLDGLLFSAHVANARGLLDEGLPYNEGDADLDAWLEVAHGRLRYLVTETLEASPDRALHMREAERRLRARLAALPALGAP